MTALTAAAARPGFAAGADHAAGRRPRAEGIPFTRVTVGDEAVTAAADVLRSGWITTGPRTFALEAAVADLVCARHAVAVSSCTAALEIALRALRLPPGAPVLVPTLTFCGAVHAVVHAGLRPVLVDVDAATATMTPQTVRTAARVHGAAALMALHLAGLPADVPALADAAGLDVDRVVEDAAHALGARRRGRHIGSSAATCFSFYATKNLPIGEGGLLATDDDTVADLARRARLHGMSTDAWRRYQPGGSWRYTVDAAGLKANFTDVQAAIGLAQLKAFPSWQRRRAEIAARYDAGLAAVPGIAPPPRADAGDEHAWHLYAVRVEPGFPLSRDELAEELGRRGIGTSVHFIPAHHMPYFQRVCDIPAAGLPQADVAFSRLLSLPMYPDLGDDEVDRVVAAIAEAGVDVASAGPPRGPAARGTGPSSAKGPDS